MKKLEEYVVSIPDYPEKGIIFRDVTSILQDADGLLARQHRSSMIWNMEVQRLRSTSVRSNRETRL